MPSSSCRRAQGHRRLAHEDRAGSRADGLGSAPVSASSSCPSSRRLVDHAGKVTPSSGGRAPGRRAGVGTTGDHDRRHAATRAQRARPTDRAQPARLAHAPDECRARARQSASPESRQTSRLPARRPRLRSPRPRHSTLHRLRRRDRDRQEATSSGRPLREVRRERASVRTSWMKRSTCARWLRVGRALG